MRYYILHTQLARMLCGNGWRWWWQCSGNIKMKIPDVFTTCKLFAEGLYCAVE